MAPTEVSGLPSQRRDVGPCPIPTAATCPRCSHTPRPSRDRYIDWGAFSVIMRYL